MSNRIPYRYVPTGQLESSWGYHLDCAWSGLFDPNASAAFYGDIFTSTFKGVVGPHDLGICHSVMLPGEAYALRFSGIPVIEAKSLEASIVRSFRHVFTLSSYFQDLLRSHGFQNVKGPLLYPPPLLKRKKPQKSSRKQVVIAQRFSEEKLPLLVMEVARNMPDINFIFVHALEPREPYVTWLQLASRNVSSQIFPTRDQYTEFIANSDCGLVISARDNFGVSVLECLSLGVPCVAPRLFAFPELIKDSFCLYEPYSLIDVERAIRYALNCSGSARAPWTIEESTVHLQEEIKKICVNA